MKSCEEYLPLLSLAVDGMLTKEEEAELSQHLLGCEHCRGVKAQYEAMSKAFSELSVTPPEALHSRVMEAVKKDAATRRARGKKRLLSYMAAAAACFVVVGLGLSSRLSSFEAITGNTTTMAADADLTVSDEIAPVNGPDDTDTSDRADTAEKNTTTDPVSDGAVSSYDMMIEDSVEEATIPEVEHSIQAKTPTLMQSSALTLPTAHLHCTDQQLFVWLTEYVEGAESPYTITSAQYTALLSYLEENAVPYEVSVSQPFENLSEDEAILLVLSPESTANQ